MGLWLLAGLCVGWFNGVTQVWTVARLPQSYKGAALFWVVGGALLRWIVTLGMLLMASRQGVWALCLALLGLWVMRWVLILRVNASKSRLVQRFSS